jgi:hypothetical protein
VASAQGGADGELALAANGTRQDKIGHVGNGNDKDKSRCCEQNKENRARAGGDLLTQAR